MTGWVTATLELWHTEWLLTLDTLQTCLDKNTARQKDKKTTWQKGNTTKRQKKQNDEKIKRQKDKKSKRQKDKKTIKQKDKKQNTKRQNTKSKKRVLYCDVRAVSHSCDVCCYHHHCQKHMTVCTTQFKSMSIEQQWILEIFPSWSCDRYHPYHYVIVWSSLWSSLSMIRFWRCLSQQKSASVLPSCSFLTRYQSMMPSVIMMIFYQWWSAQVLTNPIMPPVIEISDRFSDSHKPGYPPWWWWW